MKVYVVTDGSYSDYHIVAVFTDEQKAKDCKELFLCDEIEEYDCNPDIRDCETNKLLTPYFIRMSKDGRVESIEIEKSSYGFFKGDKTGFDVHKNMYTHVLARDEAHAIKIANERRTMLIANNEWRQ